MRVDLQKILFIGPESKKDDFLFSFQQAGTVQFIGTKVAFVDLLASEFQEVVQAVKILQQFEVEQTPSVVVTDPLSFSRSVVADALKLSDSKSNFRIVQEELERIAPFGQIPLDLISSIESETRLQFRLWVATKKRNASAASPHLITVAEDAHYQYFISMTDDLVSAPGLESIPLTKETATLANTQVSLQRDIAFLEESLKLRASLIESLKISLVTHLNEAKRDRASHEAQPALEGRLFAMTGWVPQTDLQQAQSLARSLEIFTDLLPTPPDEIPPTYLKNEKIKKIGEDLVNIYDTPSHTDTDPSSWVLGFFALFFAMIIGDAGYGLLFLATALYLRYKTKKESPSMTRLVKLVAILGASCVVWGFLTNSFFSMEFSPENPLRAYSPLTYLVELQAQYHIDLHDKTFIHWVNLHDGIPPTTLHQFLYESPSPGIAPFYGDLSQGTLLELSLLIGSLHIMISVCRYLKRNIGNAGWLLCIVGGYFCCANYLHAPSMMYYLFGLDPESSASIGFQLLTCGLLFSFMYSIIKNGVADVFFTAMTAVSVFADVLSYLRLYALGLSGSIVSHMINGLADTFPFVIAVILIILSHGVNIAMAVVGGVIHGLRLNFLEWYHYSFEGGGKPFSPLCLEKYE